MATKFRTQILVSIILLVFGASVFADRAAPTPLTKHAQVPDAGYVADPVELLRAPVR